ncbi:MAG: cyclic nucleotide-binding domain-containing protein [Stomatobaculum sp.]|nr:cyclic nucleotide-binding domain-containing protein [Stomatobaculum sp.]
MASEKEILEGLKTFPLLSNLPEEDLARLASIVEEEHFPAGTKILTEGEFGDKMYMLWEGNVDVLKTTLYGEPYVAASLKDSYHCFFGEMALIDRGERSASIRAKTDCRTLSIGHEDFQRFCREYPNVGIELLMSISSTLVHNLRMENENLHIVYQALIEEIEEH